MAVQGHRERGEEDRAHAQDAACLHAADLELAREALAGRESARRQFAERMQCVPRFLAAMNARLGRPLSDVELEDLVQETLVEIWRRLGSYAGLATLQTWAYRFCQQVLSSRLRATQRRPVSLPLDETRERAGQARSSLDYEHLYGALERLDPQAAAVVRARHFDQLSFEEIAARLGLPESSAKAACQRGLARLRELLDPLRREAGL